MTDYELRIRIENGNGGPYRVFASGPTGEATGTFELPFDERDVQLFVLGMSRGRDVRKAESYEMGQITAFGAALFDSLFRDRIGDAYRVSRALAERDGSSLRVTLALKGVPKLMRLPWEYLYDDPEFVALSEWTPLVRYLELPNEPRPLKVELPLRILAMVSSPEDTVALDTQAERENLETALAGLRERGAVEITWVEDATLSTLLHTLHRGQFHVFHFIGHGEYNDHDNDGILLLEDSRGRAQRVTGGKLGTFLAGHKTLRLAILNACDGARSASDDPFAGVATSLVQRQIPAVIAMQFEITDAAAIVFAGEFYWKLADCGKVDSAVAFARQALLAAGNDVEWATPVLFMRVPNGCIFDVPQAPVEHPESIVEQARNVARERTSPVVPVAADPEAEAESPQSPPRRRLSARFAAALALVAGFVLAMIIAAFALNDSNSDSKRAASVVSEPPPPTTTASRKPRWTLRAAIPASVRSSCDGREGWIVPGSLTPLVDAETGERAHFRSTIACPHPPVPVRVVQYSLARSDHDLTRYFESRANGGGLPAHRTTAERCFTTAKASNYWKPRGKRGHALTSAGKGAGRVICYFDKWNHQPRIEWTDTRSGVYGFAEGPGREALLRWWRTGAGPAAP